MNPILALVEAGDALTAMLQTLRHSPTPEHAQDVYLHLLAMAHHVAELSAKLAQGFDE
jgi:hypothetical protein